MKKVVYSLGMLALVAAVTVPYQSCNIKDKVIENLVENFDLDGGTITFDIPIITDTTGTVNGDTTMVDLNLDAKIKEVASSLGTNDIETINITECKLTINNSDANNDASNFKSATASLYSDVNTTPVTISTNGDVPNTPGTEITLTPATVNLADYMKTGTKLYYYASAHMRKATTKVLNCTMKVKYKVDFK